MISDDQKEQLKAEYWQTKIRYEKLKSMLEKYETRLLDENLTCSPALLRWQLVYMEGYLRVLDARTLIERINCNHLTEVCLYPPDNIEE